MWLAWVLFEYFSAGLARGERSGQSALNLPVWPFRLVFVVAFALFALQVLAELLKSARALFGPAPAPVPAPGTSAATAAAGAATAAGPAPATETTVPAVER